jgi:hypothetical protein
MGAGGHLFAGEAQENTNAELGCAHRVSLLCPGVTLIFSRRLPRDVIGLILEDIFGFESVDSPALTQTINEISR